MEEYPIYLGGEFVSTSDLLEITNPYSGHVFASTYLASDEDYNIAIQKAINAQKTLSEFSSADRYSILTNIGDEIKKNRDRLAKTLAKESAKPITYAFAEIDRARQTFLIAAEETKRLPKEYIDLDWTSEGENKEGLVKYFPIGPIAGITPFNFPLNLVAHKVAPAIAAGCPIIIKPASSTPLSCLELAKIIDKTDLPKGAFSVLPTNRKTGDVLVTDERIKLLSFTGSPTVGWEMKKRAGKKKVTLELGGNAGVIIHDDIEPSCIIDRCVVGGFAYSGQVCIHAQRFYVHESIFNDFSKRFVETVKKLRFGNPESTTTQLSSIIDKKNVQRIDKWVKAALNGGAKLLSGGNLIENNGFEPTILTNTNKSMLVNSEEVFGPVVIIEKYTSFDNAIDLINESNFGLQAGVFTNDQRLINQAFKKLEVGGVISNDIPTFRVDHMPYGGVKDSGFGREGVKYAILDMLEPKILVKSTH